MKTSLLLPALLCAALTATFTASGQDDLRAEAEKLIEKARQAKAEGRNDEAENLMRQVKKIQGALQQKLAQVGAGEDKPGNPKQEMQRMRREIDELHQAGKHDDAVRLEQKFESKFGSHPATPERIRHIFEAVEHLHAAGLDEPAERLSEVARKMREDLERSGGSAGGPPSKGGENPMREVSESMHQLRGQMEKMQRQIEELRAQIGKPHGDKEGR